MSIQIQGLQESLRVLGKVEPELKKSFMKNVQRIAKPLATTIDSRVPKQAPLSGWDHNGAKGWAPKKVSIRTDTRLPRRRPNQPGVSTLNVIRITTRGSSVAIADMAGKANGTSSRAPLQRRRPNFASALTARLGDPSRFMWRDIDESIQQIVDELQPYVREVTQRANQEMMRIR